MLRVLMMAAILALPAGWDVARAATVTVPGSVTLVPLDASTVVTGGTPVVALMSGNRSAGGWLYNPSGATTNLCISETSIAPGVAANSYTTCIPPGFSYVLTPAVGSVSVNASDSGHAFNGLGYK